MNRKLVLAITLTFILGIVSVAVKVQRGKAYVGAFHITADGSVYPSTAPIQRQGDLYLLTDNIISTFHTGIEIERNNMTLDGAGYTIQGAGSASGIELSGRINVTIRNVGIRGFFRGICLGGSSNNSLAGNNMTENKFGIWLYGSSNYNTISENIFSKDGLFIQSSYGNVVENNTVNGKPLAYLEGVSDYTMSGNAGQVILINCNNIQLANFNLSDTTIGLELSGTMNSNIANNNITNNNYGIYLEGSSENVLSGNKLTKNSCGISLDTSSNNSIVRNNIRENDWQGIYLDDESSNNFISGNNITANNESTGISIGDSSNDNNISGNNIASNEYGIIISGCSNNVYHNNFVNNTSQIHTYGTMNVWDNCIEGNYWSNYTGVDLDHDGIGDSSHKIDANNTDHYPLMGMFSRYNTSLGYHVNVISNSTIEDFGYFKSNNTIKIYVSSMIATQTFGFCRVCISKDLMSPPYTVIIDDGVTEALHFNDTIYDNGTHRWIYFAYKHSIHRIDIIPEFPLDTTSPSISILSPENKTYLANDVPLTFTLSEATSWIGYNLDDQQNQTITGNRTLSDLTDGLHSLVVYATDTAGNTGASETIYFTVETLEPEPFPIWIVAAIAVIVVFGATLLVYYTKFRKTTEKSKY